jgi:GT2 family glycosyltransferase
MSPDSGDHPAANGPAGVSVVVPVRDGERWLGVVLDSILAQDDGRPFEIIAVEDGSRDGSANVLRRYEAAATVRVVAGERRGAAAAINAGVRAAAHPVICQVDQDVILDPGWLARLVAALSEPGVGAAQGYYRTDPADGWLARVMGRDLEARYARLNGGDTDHVCTGNAAYRAEALRQVGGFDEAMGYGYDNDMSYRLSAAGFRLVMCPEATSVHRWRTSWRGYLAQQYGVGYGRLDVVARHRHRFAGDAVSPAPMMAHPALMLVAVALSLLALLASLLGRNGAVPALAATAVVAALAVERAVVGVGTFRRFGDAAALWFPVVHLARDLAWTAAIAVWCARRLSRRPSRPAHSMGDRRPGTRLDTSG